MEYMKFKAILSRYNNDNMKSKIMNEQHVQLVLDAYMNPAQFAELIETYNEIDFFVEVYGQKTKS